MAKDKRTTPNERLLQLIRRSDKDGDASVPVASGTGTGRGRALRWRLFPLGRQVHVGVDISQSQMVCVKLRGQDTDYEVLGASIVPLPEGATPGTEAFVTLLRATLSGLCAPGETPRIWAASQATRVNLQYVTIPKVPSRQVDNAVFWTAKKEMAFDEASVVFDFERRGEVSEKGAARIGVLAYTAMREAVRRIQDDFVKAGYPLAGLTMDPFAHQNLYRRRVVAGKVGATANLHVGREWSRLEICNNGDLMFVRVIKTSMAGMEQAVLEALEARQGAGNGRLAPQAPVSVPSRAPAAPIVPVNGESVVDLDSLGQGDTGFVLELDAPMEAPQAPSVVAAAPKAGGIRLEDARRVLRGLIFGCASLEGECADMGLDEAEILSMLEPAAARLVRQVEMTLKHFRESLGFDAVTQLTVSGLLGASEMFINYIGEQLGLPCAALDPLGARRSKGWLGGPDLPAPGVVYAQALGLALSDNAITPNALYTYKAKAEIRSARALEQGTLVALALVLLGLAFFTMDALWNRQNLAQDQGNMSRELESLGGKPDLAVLSGKVAAVKARREAVQVFLRRGRVLGLWGTVLSLAPEGVGLGNLTAEFAPPRDEPKPGAQSKPVAQPATVPGRVVLTEMVTGDSRVFDSKLASYVVALESSALFETVAVKQSELEALGSGATGLRFMIVLTVVEN